MIDGGRLRRPVVRAIGLLALLAYVPALSAAPGRMPSDSKLYLFLDPGRFLADAASTFDGRQFAGWVPHQHVAYLWPSGPWFWLFDLLAVPDWVAHRLWIGSIMLAAGAGVRWCVRLLGLGEMAALSAAVVYQLALYVLPYVSRTSVMLLPWAGLGWIVAFAIRASRRGTWGDPAALALVVLTVGAVNATALAMIVPGPVLWLVHAVWQRSITWRQAAVVAGRTAVLCVGVSLWWIAMLAIQGRTGTDVLPYSESLADVSLTATSTEVWRSLGYWLFYVRDPAGAATTESLRYLVSTPAIIVSYLIPLAALASLAWLRWLHRRFAILLVVTGIVLAVGVHPVDDRAPLMRVLAGDDDGGLALALRSSTRALPLLMLGIALALAMAVDACSSLRMPRWQWPGHAVAGATVIAIAVVNLPSLWTGAFVDPALERDQTPPRAWVDAAEALDAETGARVLQLPGAEFGAYRWGYTVDQPLPGLTDKPLVTRDLLPLGSAGAMDLLYALDDRIQDGVLEPASVAPVASLLGADTIWLTNDIAFDRFRTARPEVTRDLVIGAPAVGTPTAYGEPFLNRPATPFTDERALGDGRVGEPLRPVELAPLTNGGTIIRAADHQLLVSGNGDGLVDAAAAGLLAPEQSVVRYTADLDERAASGRDAVGLLVTDSNRDRARHWRGSQDVTGFTETGGTDSDLLRPAIGDARLDLFDRSDRATQTVTVQRGPVTATATSYGEPFAYLPEHRPVMAIDGDRESAWLVGEHGDAVGESIRLEYEGTPTALTLHQPAAPGARKISLVRVIEADPTLPLEGSVVELDERSWSGDGQVVPLASGAPSGIVEIVIEAVAGGEPFTASAVVGVGFSEIDLGLGSTEELVRPPHDALRSDSGDGPLALAFTRLRTDPMDRWRDDPEPALAREFDLPADRVFDVEATVRIDARADDQTFADLFGWPAVASTRLTGSPRHAGVAALDGDPSTSWITSFDEAHLARLQVVGASEPIEQIRLRQPVAGFSKVRAVAIRSGEEERVVTLVPDASGAATGRVSPPLPAGDLEITLTDVEPATTVDRRFGDPVMLPAAVSEIDFAGRPDVVPIGEQRIELECVPVLSIDGAVITATIEVSDDSWLDGGPLAATLCDATSTLDAGSHVIRQAAGTLPITLDRVVLDGGLRAALASTESGATATVIDQSRFARTVDVGGCDDGCWLILGEGFNDAWTASGPNGSLGPPQMLDGGFNGWWVEPSTAPVRVDVRWTAQRPLTLALVLSLLTAGVASMLVVRDRRRGSDVRPSATASPTLSGHDGRLLRRTTIVAAATWVVASGLLIGPAATLWGLVAAAAVLLTRRRRLGELTALASLLVVAVVVVVRERRSAPLPNGGWPGTFESLHALGMFAVVGLLVAAVTADDAQPDGVRPGHAVDGV